MATTNSLNHEDSDGNEITPLPKASRVLGVKRDSGEEAGVSLLAIPGEDGREEDERLESDTDLQADNAGRGDGEETPESGNVVSIYVFSLLAVVGAVLIVANRFTEDYCAGIQQQYMQWIIAGPQIVQILALSSSA